MRDENRHISLQIGRLRLTATCVPGMRRSGYSVTNRNKAWGAILHPKGFACIAKGDPRGIDAVCRSGLQSPKALSNVANGPPIASALFHLA